jgi:hypothetical protein
VVLREAFCSPVENQQLRKKKTRLAAAASPAIAQKLIVLPSREFSLNVCARKKNNVALKLCKPEKSVEGREVSGTLAGDFHKLFNTCVEILMSQKYFSLSSACDLPCARQCRFDRDEFQMVEYEIGRTR